LNVAICIDHLKVFSRHSGVCILDIPELAIDTKDTTGIWGPSGSGKTTLLNTLNGLNFADKNLRVEGTVQIGKKTFSSTLDPANYQKNRNGAPTLFTIQQHLYSGLSPVHTMGTILADMTVISGSTERWDIQEEAKHVIEQLHLPEDILDRYPHQVSGGEIQRFHLIAAVLRPPDFILLDEATASLDYENSMQFFNVLLELKSRLSFGLLVVSHDQDLVRTYCQQVVYLDKGKIQTERPQKTNQKGIQMTPCNRKTHAGGTLVEAKKLTKGYPAAQNQMTDVLSGVSFTFEKGQFYGLCGSSGSGKSTIGKIISGILPADSGVIRYGDTLDKDFTEEERLIQRLKHPYIFQDALETLNPAYRLQDLVKRYANEADTLGIHQPFITFKRNIQAFGLENGILQQFPHQLSGGQAQRIQLALAMMFEPRLLIMDEPFAFIDEASIESILNHLLELKQTHGLSIFCISHQEFILHMFCDEVYRLLDGSFLKIK
jgi:peptide/nickel transport system ATP-binding protein